jgi:hypothetical protein
MILRPKTLATAIIASFVMLLMTASESHNPSSMCGCLFWVSFMVFAFCCIHLTKNEKYYSKYIDDEEL